MLRQILAFDVHVSNRTHVLVEWAFCFEAEDGIRDLVRSRGLGDVYKRQTVTRWA